MANANRDKGMRFQLECRKYAQKHGFPTAHNLSGAGVDDKGDVMLCDHVVLECKDWKVSGKGRMPDGQLGKWLAEAENEARNLGVLWGVLVVKQAYLSTGQALCYLPYPMFGQITSSKVYPPLLPVDQMTHRDTVLTLTYAATLALIREKLGKTPGG